MPHTTDSTTHFGFRKVATEEKETLVRGVFNNVASRYDIMNDFMSGGLHRVWKNDMVSWLAPRDGMKILDVAGGTGDIAFRMLKRAACEVTVCDINEQMVIEGRDRAIDQNNTKHVEWMCGNAESLPFADNTWDAYTIAFGIRNVTHIDKALAEAFRVLKPGGRFMCLEFSQVQPEWMRRIYDVYSFNVIPRLGQLVAGDSESYQYLVESIRQFPPQDTFADMIRQAGFGNVQYRNLTHGTVAIHSGRKF